MLNFQRGLYNTWDVDNCGCNTHPCSCGSVRIMTAIPSRPKDSLEYLDATKLSASKAAELVASLKKLGECKSDNSNSNKPANCPTIEKLLAIGDLVYAIMADSTVMEIPRSKLQLCDEEGLPTQVVSDVKKSEDSLLLTLTNIKTGEESTVTFTPVVATTNAAGIVRLATQEEVTEGTSTDTAITPKTLANFFEEKLKTYVTTTGMDKAVNDALTEVESLYVTTTGMYEAVNKVSTEVDSLKESHKETLEKFEDLSNKRGTLENIGFVQLVNNLSKDDESNAATPKGVLKAITEAVIDQATGKAAASKIYDASGKTQQQINDEREFDSGLKTWSGRTQESKNRDFVTDKDYGAIGDGTYHPLSERYSTLALAQLAYANIAEKITSLDQSIDWAAAQSAITANSRVYLSDGHRVITDTIIIPDNHGFYSASKPRSVGTTEFSKYKTAFLFYGTGAKNYTISDITDADHQTANPDAGADYLADSGTRGDVYKLRNYAENFSVGVDLGDGSYLENIAVIPYYDGVTAYADSSRKDSAHKWDVGILCANANYWELKSVHSVGQWRKAGCLVASSALAHHTRKPSSEGWLISNSRFQGGAGLSIRSEDITATTDNNGFGSATIFNSWAIGFEHQSMHLATSSWFDAPLDRPSTCLEIHGKTMRGIDFISCTFMSREDVSIFAGSCNEIKMTLCYQEGKNLKIDGNWLTNKVGARNLLKAASSIQMYQHSKYGIDTSPNYPRESSASRYSAPAGVWENNFAIDEDYESVRYINSFGFRLRRDEDKWVISNTSDSNIHTIDNVGNVVASGSTTSAGFNSSKKIVLTGTGLESRLLNTSNNTDIAVWVTKDNVGSPSFRAVGSTGDLQIYQDLVVAANNTQSIGEAGRVVKDIHLGAAPIVSSDERLKQQFRSQSEREKAAALEIKNAICLYKFNDAVDLKGDGARWHVGVKAQQVISILESYDLNPSDYGFVCFDEWDATDEHEAGSRYAIRYDELIMFILAAL